MNSLIKSNKTMGSIDIAKFFFAICIVALHTGADSFLPINIQFYIEKLIFRLAVPFFFVSSGFFFGKKIYSMNTKDDVWQNVKKYCLRLLKPLAFFSCINIAIQIVSFLRADMSIGNIIIKVFQAVVFYPYGALWYIQASIVGILLLYPFFIKRKIKTALFVGVGLYLFALLCNSYYFVIQATPLQQIIDAYLNICVSARNGLFTGFLFLAIGIFVGKNYTKFISNKKLLFITTGLLGILYIVETIILSSIETLADDGSLFVLHLLFIPALFLSISVFPCTINEKATILMRNLSTGVYLLHRPILFFVGIIFTNGMICFVLTFTLSIFVCLAAYRFKIKPFDNLLK